MPRQSTNVLRVLATLPWWYSVLIATIVYVGMTIILPAIFRTNPFASAFVEGLAQVAPWAFFLFLLPVPVSLFNSWRKRQQLDTQQDLHSIRNLSWQQFEELVGEAYRRHGYKVIENDGAGPDGGIDLIISQDGKRYLVQCKQYRSQKVGVKVVREMYGLVASEHADGGIVITSGQFTRDAGRFADEKTLKLVNGEQLLVLVAAVQDDHEKIVVPVNNRKSKADSNFKSCPVCNRKMVLRTAGKGKNIGKKFWGCSAFPKCRGTRAYNSV